MDAKPTAKETLILVYATFPSLESAESVGAKLLEQQLVACVNLLPGMVSLYRWQGRQQRDQEVVMIAKTRTSLAEVVTETIVEVHPYDVPAVVVVDLAGGSKPFLDWISSETLAS